MLGSPILFVFYVLGLGYQSAFQKYSVAVINSLGTQYDYGSIMHTGTHYLSKNGNATIEPKQPGVRTR